MAARALTAALLDAYADATPEPTRHWADDPLMATVAAGVILYRLAARITPYPRPHHQSCASSTTARSYAC